MERHLSIREAANLLRVSISTLRNWDKAETLIAYRNPVNNYRVYKLSQIEKFINEIEGSRGGRRFRIKIISVQD